MHHPSMVGSIDSMWKIMQFANCFDYGSVGAKINHSIAEQYVQYLVQLLLLVILHKMPNRVCLLGVYACVWLCARGVVMV